MIGERTTLVLIDDDEQILVIVSQFLTFSGFEVKSFSDPNEAMVFIRSYQPQVVISDVKMGAVNGFDLARQLRDFEHPPHVILMTGYYQREFEMEAEAAGVAKILEKPVRGEDLVQVVRQLTRP